MINLLRKFTSVNVSIPRDQLRYNITSFNQNQFMRGLAIVRFYGPLPLPLRPLDELKKELEILDAKVLEVSKIVSPLLQKYGVLKLQLSEAFDQNRAIGMNLASLLSEYKTIINSLSTTDSGRISLLSPQKIKYAEYYIERYVLREKTSHLPLDI